MKSAASSAHKTFRASCLRSIVPSPGWANMISAFVIDSEGEHYLTAAPLTNERACLSLFRLLIRASLFCHSGPSRLPRRNHGEGGRNLSVPLTSAKLSARPFFCHFDRSVAE